MQGGPPIDNGINQEGNPVSAPSVGEELFTTEQYGEATAYAVDRVSVAIAVPAPQPGYNPNAWHVGFFDPFDGGSYAGAYALDEGAARELAELFARTAGRAVARS